MSVPVGVRAPMGSPGPAIIPGSRAPILAAGPAARVHVAAGGARGFGSPLFVPTPYVRTPYYDPYPYGYGTGTSVALSNRSCSITTLVLGILALIAGLAIAILGGLSYDPGALAGGIVLGATGVICIALGAHFIRKGQ